MMWPNAGRYCLSQLRCKNTYFMRPAPVPTKVPTSISTYTTPLRPLTTNMWHSAVPDAVAKPADIFASCFSMVFTLGRRFAFGRVKLVYWRQSVSTSARSCAILFFSHTEKTRSESPASLWFHQMLFLCKNRAHKKRLDSPHLCFARVPAGVFYIYGMVRTRMSLPEQCNILNWKFVFRFVFYFRHSSRWFQQQFQSPNSY